MLKAEMLLEPLFPAYRNLPLGVTANEIPPDPPDPPAANGEPGTEVKSPVVVSIEKPLMLLVPLLETYRKFLLMVAVAVFEALKEPNPSPPVGLGGPSGTKIPPGPTEKAEIVFGILLLLVYT